MTFEFQKNQRRSPKQARSLATCDAILEAASQILERDGAAGFNTNTVAERAGVSIGTLYQYFPDKTAILLAAAEREAASAGPRPADRHKALLRALLGIFDSLGFGAHRVRGLAVAEKPARERRQVVIRLQWAPPTPWLQPLLKPIPARIRRPHR